MATYSNHSIVYDNGGAIYLPPYSALTGSSIVNLATPDLYDSTALQKYPIAACYREGIRSFYYSKVSATTTVKTAGYGMCTVATYKDLANSVISGTSGESTVQINYGGACTADAYAGGFLGIKGNHYSSRYIITNTVQDASNYVTFTVDGTWPTDLTTTDDVVLMENPYKEVRWYITADSRPYVGCTTITIVASEYTWLQTWGPYMMASAFNSWEGGDGNQFGVYFYHGSFQALPDNTSGAVHGSVVGGGCQQAGWFCCGSDPSSPADVSIAYPVFLTINP